MPDQAPAIIGFESFEFALAPALLKQLVSLLDRMPQGQLTPVTADQLPNAQGVYQLFHRDKLVYVGKTDAEAGLRQRLSRHAWTIMSRHNLSVDDISFRAVEVLVFSAMDLETALIEHYKRRDQKPAWNGSGFGSNDPGRKRDTTALKADGFDANYPINIDIDVSTHLPLDPLSAHNLLSRITPQLPYTLRFERSAGAIQELHDATVQLTAAENTVRSIISRVCRTLPAGWQATRLAGRVIMYREAKDDYPGGEIIARS